MFGFGLHRNAFLLEKVLNSTRLVLDFRYLFDEEITK